MRGSRTVLRAAGGEVPLVDSPPMCTLGRLDEQADTYEQLHEQADRLYQNLTERLPE